MWDASRITDMETTFDHASRLNGDISARDGSGVNIAGCWPHDYFSASYFAASLVLRSYFPCAVVGPSTIFLARLVFARLISWRATQLLWRVCWACAVVSLAAPPFFPRAFGFRVTTLMTCDTIFLVRSGYSTFFLRVYCAHCNFHSVVAGRATISCTVTMCTTLSLLQIGRVLDHFPMQLPCA